MSVFLSKKGEMKQKTNHSPNAPERRATTTHIHRRTDRQAYNVGLHLAGWDAKSRALRALFCIFLPWCAGLAHLNVIVILNGLFKQSHTVYRQSHRLRESVCV